MIDIKDHRDSACWRSITEYATNVIQSSVHELTSFGCAEEKSIYLRGRIDAMRELLAQHEETINAITIKPFSL